MQVINVEYMSKLDKMTDIVVVLVYLAALVGFGIFLTTFFEGLFWVSLVAGIICVGSTTFIVWGGIQKVDEIKYKEVVFTDDEIPTSLLEEYEITKERGDIYRLTPIDNKLLNEEDDTK